MVRTSEHPGTIAEIFRSFQGEGILAGMPQVFLRFAGCDRACSYCDTAWARAYQGEKTRVDLGGGKKWLRPNPWNPRDLAGALKDFGSLPVWLTGGEPLLQVDFLDAFLPLLEGKRAIGLETHGLLPHALRRIVSFLSWIAADAKLPSSTGEPVDWEAFSAFLEEGKGHGLFVKVVLTASTEPEEVKALFIRMSDVDSSIPLILQPVTPVHGAEAPGFRELETFALEGLTILKDVRVLPQIHRLAGWR